MTDTASLIEEIEALGKVFKSDNAVNDAYQAALIDAISIIRSHCLAQPEPAAGMVEAVARAIWRDSENSAKSRWGTPPNMYISMAKAAIAAMPQAQPVIPPGDGWQPIETVPKDGTKVLVIYSHGAIELLVWHGVMWRQSCDLGLIVTSRDQTHWMPLPNPPEHPASPSTAIEGQKL